MQEHHLLEIPWHRLPLTHFEQQVALARRVGKYISLIILSSCAIGLLTLLSPMNQLSEAVLPMLFLELHLWSQV